MLWLICFSFFLQFLIWLYINSHQCDACEQKWVRRTIFFPFRICNNKAIFDQMFWWNHSTTFYLLWNICILYRRRPPSQKYAIVGLKSCHGYLSHWYFLRNVFCETCILVNTWLTTLYSKVIDNSIIHNNSIFSRCTTKLFINRM